MTEFTFSITPYEGFEEEVLRLRNRNRDNTQTREYMDWRYLGQKSSRSPLIFWVQDDKGQRLGMAGLIFRPYWVDNNLTDFAVLGDISINSELRGKGIAKRLFQFMNSHIEKEAYSCALVIPNFAAQKSLSSSGWKVQDELVRYVNIFDLTDRIYGLTKNRALSVVLGLLYT